MNTKKTNHCCLVCLQIPTLITQNPTDFRVLPLTETVLGGKGPLGRCFSVPFLTNPLWISGYSEHLNWVTTNFKTSERQQCLSRGSPVASPKAWALH